MKTTLIGSRKSFYGYILTYAIEYDNYIFIEQTKFNKVTINNRLFYIYNADECVIFIITAAINNYGYILIPHGMLLNSYILYISLSHYIDIIEYNQTIYHLISLK